MVGKIEQSELRNKIEEMLKTGKYTEVDILNFCKKNGLDISPSTLTKFKKKLFKSVIDKVSEKSKELVDELATERLDLAGTIDDTLKELNKLLFDESYIEDLKPKNAKELASLLQAKSNLIKAEIMARGAIPQEKLQIIELIEKKEKLKEELEKKKREEPIPA